MRQLLDDLLREAKESADFLEKQKLVEIPATLDAAFKEDWLTAGWLGAEGLMEVIPKLTLSEARQRVITVEKANEILRALEEDLVSGYCQDKNHVTMKAIGAAYFQVQWLLSHAGLITVAVTEAVYHFRAEILDAYLSIVKAIRRFINGNWIDAWEAAKNAAERWSLIMIAVVATVFTTIAAVAIEPIIKACSAAGFAASLLPLGSRMNLANSRARSRALPQGRGRWRRRNPSRRN